MRLDHLLSREKMLLGTAAYFPGSGEWRERSRMLFNFEGSERDSRERFGGVAQLGEHLPCTQRVRSSNLLISTTQPEGAVEGTSEQAEKTWAHSSGG